MNPFVYRSPRIAWRQYDDETLVITSDDRKVHRLNGTGTFLWTAIGDSGKTKEELLCALAETFDAERAVLIKDLESFLADLIEKKVLLTKGEG